MNCTYVGAYIRVKLHGVEKDLSDEIQKYRLTVCPKCKTIFDINKNQLSQNNTIQKEYPYYSQIDNDSRLNSIFLDCTPEDEILLITSDCFDGRHLIINEYSECIYSFVDDKIALTDFKMEYAKEINVLNNSIHVHTITITYGMVSYWY